MRCFYFAFSTLIIFFKKSTVALTSHAILLQSSSSWYISYKKEVGFKFVFTMKYSLKASLKYAFLCCFKPYYCLSHNAVPQIRSSDLYLHNVCFLPRKITHMPIFFLYSFWDCHNRLFFSFYSVNCGFYFVFLFRLIICLDQSWFKNSNQILN